MKTIKDLLFESSVCSTCYVRVDRMLDAFSASLTKCLERVINNDETSELCDNFLLTTYDMSAAQFESGIRVSQNLPVPDYILSRYRANVIVLKDPHGVPLYVELSNEWWNKLISRFGKIGRNKKQGCSVKEEFFASMTYMSEEKKNVLFDDLSKLLFNYLIKMVESITFNTQHGDITVTADRPPRGYSGYDYQSDTSLFNGYYYIPIDYRMMDKMKFGYIFKNVKITTNRASLLGKYRYAVKALDDKFKGNMVWLPEYRIGKYDVIELGEYIKR